MQVRAERSCDTGISSIFSIIFYIITHVILFFWLVLSYDLLEDRRIDDGSARFKFFLNSHNSLLSLATNQFASFCMDIRSCQWYFRVCQSGEIWNKQGFFPYILIFLLYKTNRFHVAVRLFSNRELNHARFWDADGNRKRTFHMPGQWCLPNFCTNHL